jgi:thiol-disulfide isomerase/thioredoxin
MKNAFLPLILFGTLLTTPAMLAGGVVNGANPGKELDLKAQLVQGRTNIVDFFSKYCPPCMRISPLLEDLGQKRSDLQIVKVDINRPGITGIDWQSPLARQFGLKSIPHFKIYDGNGKLVSEGDQAYQQIMVWLKSEKLIN